MKPTHHASFRLLLLGTIMLFVASERQTVAQTGPSFAFRSGLISPQTPGHAVEIVVPLGESRELSLVVLDGGDGFGCDWADWLEPRLVGPSGEIRLSEVPWKSAWSAWGEVRRGKNAAGGEIRVLGQSYHDGIGTHAHSVITFNVPPGYTEFRARGALDDGGTQQGCGSTVQFAVATQPLPASWLTRLRGGGESRDLADAVSQLSVAEGLELTLFAGEPLVVNPSSIDVDHLGRVWVCEVMNYRRFANPQNPERPEGDRILVLEDTNGDGVCDRSTVFHQGHDVDSAHGICVLGDRVIISSGDSVFSLYDRDGDLRADPNSKELLFTGIGGIQHDHGIHAVVFGPDGKLYFNFGNSGKQLKDREGRIVRDQSGRLVEDRRQPYQEGMVFRCNLDGSGVETLGWNFRNNWEVCVDSFGTLWQSDNDDDGNRGVRINYVMEYGNYGYRDEKTGAGWQTPRTNWEAEIPQRHWHQNDPGVVPNLLLTGAGAPTGMCVYEGNLLPPLYQNQLIHCDAGPNIVRCYVVRSVGAGYEAEIHPLIEGTHDRWFRPSDVCVAPDGSLFVADWYDPGVGGHRQGDVERGRIFRLAPQGVPYRIPLLDLTTPEGAIAALCSPNLARRALGWQTLQSMRERSLPALLRLWREETNPRWRARALWVTCKLMPNKAPLLLTEAFQSENEDLQVTALRIGRQLTPIWYPLEINVTNLTKKVLRELALGCRSQPGMATQWAQLAARHDGHDRWYLEALGIGADGQWDACLDEYIKLVPRPISSLASRDILWRSRGQQTPRWLERVIQDTDVPEEELPRYFRAFDFLDGAEKTNTLMRLAFDASDWSQPRQLFTVTEALVRLPVEQVLSDATHRERVVRMVMALGNSSQALSLIARFRLQEMYPHVIQLILQNPDTSLAVEGVKLLLGEDGRSYLVEGLKAPDLSHAVSLARALGHSVDGRIVSILQPIINDRQYDLPLRHEAVKSLARVKGGARLLLDLTKKGVLSDELRPAAAFALQTTPFEDLRQEAMQLYPLPPAINDQPLPPLSEMLKQRGNVARGREVFRGVGKCITCHVVQREGKAVGPDLSEIGSKLSREALFEAILFPSAGISHNYETWSAVMNDGNVVTGIKVSETAEQLTLRGSDALDRTLSKRDIDELKKQPVSLMPADLQKTMTAQDLLDVIEYLQSLRKPR